MIPEIERAGPKLIYQQIVEWMRQLISSGNWPEHYRLPSELDLAAEMGVSRGTLRKAITQLISEGRLVSIHGRGTFVASATLEQPLAEELVAFSENLIQRGIPFITRVVEQKLVMPSQRISSLLAIPPGEPVLYLKRIRLVWQAPIVLLVNYVAPQSCPGIETVDFEHERLFATLEKRYDLKLGWAQRTFQAQAADEHVAELLNINKFDPIMYMEQVLYLTDGSPIEFSNLWFRGNSFRLSAILNRGEHRSGLQKNTMIIEAQPDEM